MAGVILDSSGNIKMKVLNDSITHWQRINGLVEAYAGAVKRKQPTSQLIQNIRRQLPTLAANLKSQFQMISDQVTATYAGSSRGASEVVRVRGLREGMAVIKTALEIAVTQTAQKHQVEKHKKEPAKDGAHEPAAG